MLLIMIGERRGPLPEDEQFFLDQSIGVISPFLPISSDIAVNPVLNNLCRTIKNNQRMNAGKSLDVSGLALVAGNTIQNKYVAPQKAGPLEEQGDNLFGEGEVLIFEQEAAFKHTVDEIELIASIGL